ncbi:TatD family hydrolase [Gleimia hominis]|uniref:TatD family hydrolase n=1 Tax=Gleimia hominis TaxID=595468 RepID=UPI000C801691|nr:TatD family hydrolase [Gleimia hominis]WIK64678.1 TatD family hydrolase [Gleimia hominis]
MSKKKRTWPPLAQPLPAAVTDNHTHLPLHEGEIPAASGVKMGLDEQLQRALNVGVKRIITVACELPDFVPALQQAKDLRNKTETHPAVRLALAIHPNEAPLHAGVIEQAPDGMTYQPQAHHVPLDEALAQVEQHLDSPEVVAVGETGLDLYRTAEAGLAAQQESFSAHLKLGMERNLPVQIHDREAHEQCVNALYRTGADKTDIPIVFHCFSGGMQLAQECAKNGWYASFGGSLTFKPNEAQRDAFKSLPRNQILIETDAPYLTPVPYRGNPNASYVMTHTIRFIADLWEETLENTCEQLERNTEQVYGKWF